MKETSDHLEAIQKIIIFPKIQTFLVKAK